MPVKLKGMGIEEIRALKNAALEPKIKKAYSIPKISEKRKKQIEENKDLAALDKNFYAEIWNSSPHKCQNCNCKLPKEPLTIFFHHLLEKRNYPQLRHVPENIMILCPDCHAQAEADIDKTPKVKVRRSQVEKTLL